MMPENHPTLIYLPISLLHYMTEGNGEGNHCRIDSKHVKRVVRYFTQSLRWDPYSCQAMGKASVSDVEMSSCHVMDNTR